MSDAEVPKRPQLEPTAPGAKVTRLELFYDLVFAFAFLNVTGVTAENLTPAALLRGLLVLALLWFAWSTFVTLGNIYRADQGMVPLVGFAIMAAIFVAAVTMPEAFSDRPPGLPGDLVFAGCYLFVRGLQVLVFWYAVRIDRRRRRRWRVLAVPVLISGALLLVAAVVPQRLLSSEAVFGARVALWGLAIAVEYSVGALVRTEGLTIVSSGHWAARHAQIVLVAFGESIIALGTGPNLKAGLPLTWPIIGASVLGITVITALWWAYSNSLADAAERVLHRSQGAARVVLARDAYTYLHLPMIAGIILFGLGLKRVLTEIADPTVPSSQDSLAGIDLYVLYGGVILYTLSHFGFQFRTLRRPGWFHLAVVLLLLALIPVADRMPAFVALAILALVTIGLLIVLAVHTSQPRQQTRSAVLAERRALEAKETQWRRQHR